VHLPDWIERRILNDWGGLVGGGAGCGELRRTSETRFDGELSLSQRDRNMGD
jgi:hypothetical protein